jgi:cytochrome c2
LIALGVMLLFPGWDALAAGGSCLHCHRSHYERGGSCVGCHRGDDRSDRLEIAHHDLIRGRFAWFTIAGSAPLLRGEKLRDSLACRRCHVTGGKGNRLASNLDALPGGATPQQLFDAIKSPALYMPDFRLDDAQLGYLVNAILYGAKQAGKPKKEVPQVVLFEDGANGKENVFAKQCGSCHKLLTRTLGGLGKGNIGPNLSGIFTRYYPITLPNGQRWTADWLKKWLDNPRKIRTYAQMQPVALKKDEFKQLLAILALAREKQGQEKIPPAK